LSDKRSGFWREVKVAGSCWWRIPLEKKNGCAYLKGSMFLVRMPAQVIKISRARQHDLKNLHLEIPREKVVVTPD
jgi:hypothetical protein